MKWSHLIHCKNLKNTDSCSFKSQEILLKPRLFSGVMRSSCWCLLSPRIKSSAKHDCRQTAGSAAPAWAATPYSVCTSDGKEIRLIEPREGGNTPARKHPSSVNRQVCSCWTGVFGYSGCYLTVVYDVLLPKFGWIDTVCCRSPRLRNFSKLQQI